MTLSSPLGKPHTAVDTAVHDTETLSGPRNMFSGNWGEWPGLPPSGQFLGIALG